MTSLPTPEEFRQAIRRPDLTLEESAQVLEILHTLAQLLIEDYLAEHPLPPPQA